MVLLGGADAGYVADLLARHGVPVVLTTVLDSPNRAWEPSTDCRRRWRSARSPYFEKLRQSALPRP